MNHLCSRWPARTLRSVLAPAVPVALVLATLTANATSRPRADASPSAAHRSGAHEATAPSTLSFRVQARVSARDMRDGSLAAGQSFDAKVYAKGMRVRVETRVAERPIVLLLSPPYVYRLLPLAHAGVRYRTNDPASGAARNLSQYNLTALLRDPAALRNALRSGGARAGGTEVVNGQRFEVWTANQFAGQPAEVKAWLRPADGLPSRLQVVSRTVELHASWLDYRRGAVLPDTLFVVPAGFRVREAQDNLAPL